MLDKLGYLFVFTLPFAALDLSAQTGQIIDEVIQEVAKDEQVEPESLSFLKNPLFEELLVQRSGGDPDEIRSLVMGTLLNYLLNPVGCYEQDCLFFGAEANAMDAEWAKTNKVTHILNVAGKFSAEFLKPLGIVYKSVTVEDVPEQKLPFLESFAFIDGCLKNNGKVLVHCIEGKSRSGAIIVAYLMQKHHWSYKKALDYVGIKRIARPNAGFERQINDFEQLSLR